MAADYSVRVLNYAHTDLPFEFCGGVPIHSGEGVTTLAMQYTLLSGRDDDGSVHHHLVDVGFDAPWIPRFGFYGYEAPDAVLAKVGLTPADIETVLVSHMHFDHVNNISRFPNAEVYVQWEEFQGWSKVLGLPSRYTPLGEQSWITSSFDRGDLAVFGGLAGEGRLHFMATSTSRSPASPATSGRAVTASVSSGSACPPAARRSSSPATPRCGSRTSRRCGPAATPTATRTRC